LTKVLLLRKRAINVKINSSLLLYKNYVVIKVILTLCLPKKLARLFRWEESFLKGKLRCGKGCQDN